MLNYNFRKKLVPRLVLTSIITDTTAVVESRQLRQMAQLHDRLWNR